MKKLFALLFAGIILYYWPYTHQSFLIWDDEAILSKYKYFHPVNFQNFIQLWIQPFNGLYTPVLKSLWAFVISILQLTTGDDWGDKDVTTPFVAINILLHAGNTYLVYKLANKILDFLAAVKPAPVIMGLALCFYAFHPLQIENINWIMGTKELLWIHFALWSLLAFFNGRILLCLLFFLLSILSKPTAIILIAIYVLLILLKKENIFGKKNLQLLVQQTAAGLALVLWTEKIQPVKYSAGLLEKILGALDSLGFYIIKILRPFPLSADYGRTYQWLQAQGWTWEQLIFVILTVFVFWGLLRFPQHRKFSLLMVALLLMPLITTSGLIGLSFQTYSNVADHYASFSLIPCAISLMWGLSFLNRKIYLSALAIYILTLAGLGWRYKSVWADNKSLLSQVLAVNSSSFMAYNNLGLVAARDGQMQEAVKNFEQAHKLNPEFAQPLLNLFSLQTKAKNFEYLKALSAGVDFGKINDHQLYFEYGSYLHASANLNGAEAAYLKAIDLNPKQALYYYRLASLYLGMNNLEKAKVNFQKASELEPGNSSYRHMAEQIQKL